MNTAIPNPGGQHALRVSVVTETYPPEVNGVARTVGLMVEALCERGHDVQLIRPRQRDEPAPSTDEGPEQKLVRGMPIPCYRHLQMGFAPLGLLRTEWSKWRPDVVHIVTEGAAANAARRLGIPTCSDFHTNFHSYSRHYGMGLFAGIVSRYLRFLHNRTGCTLVPTAEMQANLEAVGYERVDVVGRGVDTWLFS